MGITDRLGYQYNSRHLTTVRSTWRAMQRETSRNLILSDITNEGAIVGPASSVSKGKHRATTVVPQAELSRKRLRPTEDEFPIHDVCAEKDTDVESITTCAKRVSSFSSRATIHGSLRALRLGNPLHRPRFSASTTSILRSFVSSNLLDLYKCHSLNANQFLTTPYACAYSHESKLGYKSLLAVATEEGSVTIIDTSKRKIQDFSEKNNLVLQVHNNGVFDIKWSNSDRLLATASGDQSVRISDIQSTTGEPNNVFTGGHTSTVKCLAWNPLHHDLLASGGRDGNICLWDSRVSKDEGPVLVISHAHEHSPGRPEKKGRTILRPKTVTSLVYAPDNAHQIISGGAGDGILRKWDIRQTTARSSKLAKDIPLIDSSANDLTTFPLDSPSIGLCRSPRRARGICSITLGHGPSAGRIFALCCDSMIHTYNASGAAGVPLGVPQEDQVYSHRHMSTNSFYPRISISPCGRWLANGSAAGSAFLFDVLSQNTDKQGVELKGQDGEISGVDWANSSLATCADDGTVRVWRPDVEKHSECIENSEVMASEWAWAR